MDAPGLIPSLIGAPLAAGDLAIGHVESLLVDARTRRPLWLLVRLGDCPLPYTFVPAGGLRSRRDGVAVPYAEDVVRAAPVRLAAPAVATREQSARLGRHYGVRPAWGAEPVSLHRLPAPPALAAAS